MKNLLYILIFFSLLSCRENNVKKETGNIKKDENKTTDKSSSYLQLSYSIIKTRQTKSLKNDSLKNVIEAWLKQNEDADINDLVDFNLDLTSNQLSFTFEKCSSDPATIIKTRKANCIGYSALFCSLMNYTLIKKQLQNRYQCFHYVGKIYYAGQNINALFDDPFFKDHDFNIIKDHVNKNNIAVDPNLYEYIGIKRVSIKK